MPDISSCRASAYGLDPLECAVQVGHDLPAADDQDQRLRSCRDGADLASAGGDDYQLAGLGDGLHAVDHRTHLKNITLFGVDAAKVSTASEQHDERENDCRGTTSSDMAPSCVSSLIVLTQGWAAVRRQGRLKATPLPRRG